VRRTSSLRPGNARGAVDCLPRSCRGAKVTLTKPNGDHGRTRAPAVFVSTPIGSTDCKSRIDGQLAHSLTGPIPSAPARSCLESPPAATAG
jgi:hypothetical protein